MIKGLKEIASQCNFKLMKMHSVSQIYPRICLLMNDIHTQKLWLKHTLSMSLGLDKQREAIHSIQVILLELSPLYQSFMLVFLML